MLALEWLVKEKSNSISSNFDNKELDVLLSSGEQESCSLLTGAIIDLGIVDYYCRLDRYLIL